MRHICAKSAVLACLLTAGCAFSSGPKKIAYSALPTVAHQSTSASWTAKGVGQAAQALLLTPAVKDGVIYFADEAGVVQARATDSGEVLWKKALKTPLSSGPSVTSSLVLLSTRNGALIALDHQGEIQWETPLQTQTLTKVAFSQTREMLYLHGADAALYAIDANTGRTRWVFDQQAVPLMLRASAAPVVERDTVFLGASNGKLTALDARSGDKIWEYQVAVPQGRTEIQRMVDIVASPRVADDTVFVVSYQGKLVALSLTTGRPRWEKDFSAISDFEVSGGNLYITDAQEVVWSVRATDGMVNWRQTALAPRGGLTGPVLYQGRLVVGDQQGYLHYLNPEDGAWVDWQKLSIGPIVYPPLRDDRYLIVSSAQGKVMTFSGTE